MDWVLDQVYLPTRTTLTASLAITAVVTATAVWAIWTPKGLTPTIIVPQVKFKGDDPDSRYVAETGVLLAEGYKKYTKNGMPFMIRSPIDSTTRVVVLPPRYLAEVRKIPDDKLSINEHFNRLSLSKELGGIHFADEATMAAKVPLNRALRRVEDGLIQPMADICVASFKKQIPSCTDWTTIQTYPMVMQVFAEMSAHMLVGEELAEKWVPLSLAHINGSPGLLNQVRSRYPPRLRWLARYLNPDVKESNKHLYAARDYLRPTIEARIAERASAPKNTTIRETIHEDGLQWILDEHLSKGHTPNALELTKNIFVLMFASIHSSSATAVSILFDMLDRPDSMAEIRAEIANVQAQSPKWTRQSLGQLKILDSFMRESFRYHYMSQYTVQRTVMQSFSFADGLTLHKGTEIAFPAAQFNHDESVYPQSEVFDPKRSLRKRQEIDATKYHFASTSEDAYVWGTGPHACPGRFFAQEAIKLMLIYLLSHYDIKYAADGESRPPDMQRHAMILPSVGTPVMMKEATF